MARNFFAWNGEIADAAANPRTLFQIVCAANVRAVLHGIEVDPLGSTGSSVPIKFDIIEQTTQGGLADATLEIAPIPIVGTETRSTNIFKYGSPGEPTSTGNIIRSFSLHQQSSRPWRPMHPTGEMILPGGKRYGFRSLSGSISAAIRVCVEFEE